MADILDEIRQQGRRLTEPRRRIVAALADLEHATPEDIVGFVGADGARAMSVSTVYRNLEALESIGVVAHTHLDHRAPSYHLAGHGHHIHLVCDGCGTVSSVPDTAAVGFAGNVRERTGFVADMTHTAVHGRCASCNEPV